MPEYNSELMNIRLFYHSSKWIFHMFFLIYLLKS